jgi:hypothetical protein
MSQKKSRLQSQIFTGCWAAPTLLPGLAVPDLADTTTAHNRSMPTVPKGAR